MIFEAPFATSKLLLVFLNLYHIIRYNPILVAEYSCAVISPAYSAVGGERNVAKKRSLFGSHFPPGFATAVSFSYVYHYSLSTESKSARLPMVPTVQISPRGYQIFLYDCLQDVMLANIFF